MRLRDSGSWSSRNAFVKNRSIRSLPQLTSACSVSFVFSWMKDSVMTGDVSAKDKGATAPQSLIIRYLGLIKAMSVILAVLIVAALAVIVVTIYSRLTAMKENTDL